MFHPALDVAREQQGRPSAGPLHCPRDRELLPFLCEEQGRQHCGAATHLGRDFNIAVGKTSTRIRHRPDVARTAQEFGRNRNFGGRCRFETWRYGTYECEAAMQPQILSDLKLKPRPHARGSTASISWVTPHLRASSPDFGGSPTSSSTSNGSHWVALRESACLASYSFQLVLQSA